MKRLSVWCLVGVVAVAAISGCTRGGSQLSGKPDAEIPPATSDADGEPTTTGVASTSSSAAAVPVPAIEWDELPPIDTPADLVSESYDGEFLAYATVIDGGEGPTLCTPTITSSRPPQCDGVPIQGWDWGDVEHDEQAGSRWGQYVLIGRWDRTSFALTQPGAPVDWSQVNRPEPEQPIEVPCSEPEGGWWSDVTDPLRVGSADYNAAISVVNTRSELVSIDVVEPEGLRPAEIELQPTDIGWVPGVLVVRLSVARGGDEEAIRAHWGGPVCLAVTDSPSRGDLAQLADNVVELADEIAPQTGFLGVGTDDGAVQVGVWVATIEAQARLDEKFGTGVVKLTGLLWAID